MLLLGIGSAAAFLVPASPWSVWSADGQVSVEEMFAALRAFNDTTSPASPQAWGIRGTGFDGYEEHELEYIVDRAESSYLVRGSGADVQVGEILLFDDGETVSVGRDMLPQTPGIEVPDHPLLPTDPADLIVEAQKRVKVGARTAVAFEGHSQDFDSIILWVASDTKSLIRFNTSRYDADYELWEYQDWSILPSTDLRIEARTSGSETRAPTRVNFGFSDQCASGALGSKCKSEGRIFADGREVKLSELELRIVDESVSPARVNASMRLDEATKRTGNFTLNYTDIDRNGLLSDGDRYEVTYPNPISGAGISMTRVRFFDLWADDYTG